MPADDYMPVAIFVIVGLLFPLVTMFVTRLFRPKNPSRLKRLAYECGETPIGDAHIDFNFQWYMFALIFVAFDIVAVFLFLWAVTFQAMSISMKLTGLLFMGLLFSALAYGLKKEARIWI